MDNGNPEYKRLESGDDTETPPLANHAPLKSGVKRPLIIIAFCVVFELLHFLLIWSAYDVVQRSPNPKLPEIDGRECFYLIAKILVY